jgi:cysteine desulfurase
MIYLDYTANTPVHEEVLSAFNDISRRYIANPNAAHRLGKDALGCLNDYSQKILALLELENHTVIYTSGATEANNLAVKGAAHQYKNKGMHVISTYLEHASVNGPLAALQSEGFEIDYVESDADGLISLEHLSTLLRRDTILASVCCVDSESGVTQQLDRISKLLSGYPNCRLHVDATQTIGKTKAVLDSADLISLSPHKFYGLNGCGALIIKADVMLEVQMHGGISTTPFRSGTPALGLAAGTAKALELVLTDFDDKLEYVGALNKKIRSRLKEYLRVRINSTVYSVPHILNISIMGVNTETFKAELEKDEIYLSTRSACCAPNTVSRPIYAITKDKKRATSTLRISLSPLTTQQEIDLFLTRFDACYKKFAV